MYLTLQTLMNVKQIMKNVVVMECVSTQQGPTIVSASRDLLPEALSVKASHLLDYWVSGKLTIKSSSLEGELQMKRSRMLAVSFRGVNCSSSSSHLECSGRSATIFSCQSNLLVLTQNITIKNALISVFRLDFRRSLVPSLLAWSTFRTAISNRASLRLVSF